MAELLHDVGYSSVLVDAPTDPGLSALVGEALDSRPFNTEIGPSRAPDGRFD